MQEIISCPSCKRKLQVPEGLIGQDVQCPTCGATFTARVGGPAPTAPAGSPGRYSDDRWTDDRDSRRDRDRDWDRDRGGYGDSGPRRDLMPHRGSAVLTLGIISIVAAAVFGWCYGVGTVASIIMGPIAWVMGNTDLTEIRAGRMDPDGEGSTNAGRICGIVGTALGALGLVGWCIIFGIIIVSLNAK